MTCMKSTVLAPNKFLFRLCSLAAVLSALCREEFAFIFSSLLVCNVSVCSLGHTGSGRSQGEAKPGSRDNIHVTSKAA